MIPWELKGNFKQSVKNRFSNWYKARMEERDSEVFTFPQVEYYVLMVSVLTKYSSMRAVQRISNDEDNEWIHTKTPEFLNKGVEIRIRYYHGHILKRLYTYPHTKSRSSLSSIQFYEFVPCLWQSANSKSRTKATFPVTVWMAPEQSLPGLRSCFDFFSE